MNRAGTENTTNDPPDSNNTSGASTQPDLFACFTPEEIVLVAGVFAIAVASELSDQNASSLAFFLSTVGSDIGLFIDRRSRGRAFNIPGLG